MNYSKIVDFDLAVLLDDRVEPEDYSRYAITECTNVYGDTVEHFMTGDLITGGIGYIYGKDVYAPTYAEVIDWLHDNGFIIELNPAFTFSTIDHIAYYFNLYEINNDKVRLDLIYNDPNWMGSFEDCIKDIVKWLIQNKLI